MTLPTDFVILADVSGSMQGEKLRVARDALLKLSSMFNECDRVALVAFDDHVTQLTPLAPLANEEHKAAFRRQVMDLEDNGGTNIGLALSAAGEILSARARTAYPSAAHVLLLTDGCDNAAALQDERVLSRLLPPGCVLSTLGFGVDHDATMLSHLAARGKGSFSFVEMSSDLLDETLAAYVGDATRVLAPEVHLQKREGAKPTSVTLSAVISHAPGGDGGGDSSDWLGCNARKMGAVVGYRVRRVPLCTRSAKVDITRADAVVLATTRVVEKTAWERWRQGRWRRRAGKN